MNNTTQIIAIAVAVLGRGLVATAQPAPHGELRSGPLASPLLRPFQMQAEQYGADPTADSLKSNELLIPDGFAPWWQEAVNASMRKSAESRPVDLQSLIIEALRYSPQVLAISDGPLIRATSIIEAEAEFDVQAFMESKFSRTSEPVGNTLTTGGPSRFRDGNWHYIAGLEKKMPRGGTVRLSQRFGFQDNNSIFFVPDPQGTSRLTLGFDQPLLNGAGKVYNESLIVLANVDTRIAKDQFAADLQEHLLKVTQAYWSLYRERAILQQKLRHFHRAKVILEELDSRQGVDALESQIVRAKAAVATRYTEWIRTGTAIRNLEGRIRELVNSPELLHGFQLELIPQNIPAHDYVDISLRDAVLTALDKRPEVDASLQGIRAASVREGISDNELLPALNFFMETYVSGLAADSAIGDAYRDQFREGEPSYSVGLRFEVPIHNRAARARNQRRRLEARKLLREFQASIQGLMVEVENVAREVKTSYREMHGKYRAMMASDAEVRYLRERWRLLSGDDRSASFLLEDLLDAQDRLASEEAAFADAQVVYTVSLTGIKRAMGILLESEQVSSHEICRNGLPAWALEKTGSKILPLSASDIGTTGPEAQPTAATNGITKIPEARDDGDSPAPPDEVIRLPAPSDESP